MRFIYVDEAGTAPKEKIRIVVGVIVEADQQLEKMEREVRKIYDWLVPSDIRKNFIFHATDIYIRVSPQFRRSGGRLKNE